MTHEDTGSEKGDWTEFENDLIVAFYLDMLKLELAGEHYVKSQRNLELQRALGRSRGAIEFKHMNISAALEALGFPRIAGYAPMRNIQSSLVDAIEKNFNSIVETTAPTDASRPAGFSDDAAKLTFVEAPELRVDQPEAKDLEIERLVRKFDPAERDLRNRKLGKKGEELVLQTERLRLMEFDPKLASKVRWISEEVGDGAGFDILSFDRDGREKFIEVKTTMGCQTTPFYLSRNELDFSEERKSAFRLVRLYDFSKSPKAFELHPPLTSAIKLEPYSYTASFR